MTHQPHGYKPTHKQQPHTNRSHINSTDCLDRPKAGPKLRKSDGQKDVQYRLETSLLRASNAHQSTLC
ncbi:hypothetical protein RRG08_024739 [Elysia crispata]|uniref:Uncharacterized protein n=1 Tax=Elysia crispata TaxID=231223 RepID=A0AAE0YEL0_9GAST|nr:hypothetical protein RRG08_024739 [Elysia crispata]